MIITVRLSYTFNISLEVCGYDKANYDNDRIFAWPDDVIQEVAIVVVTVFMSVCLQYVGMWNVSIKRWISSFLLAKTINIVDTAFISTLM